MATRRRSDIEPQLSTLRTELRGEILLPDDEAYDDARSVWNGMIDRRPALIVQPTGTADVVAAVDFACESGLEIAVHGGGHNVAGYAVSDGGLMIDLSGMTGVSVDREARTVRAEGGATLGDVDHETQLFGLATPLGVVSETGIAGLTLNGGYGHLSREYGLSVDNLLEVEIVTADGEVRTANDQHHEDLFWAVRGGGGNFGVVTAFEYDLHDVDEVYQVFAWYHGEEAATMLARFREWTESAPRTAAILPFAATVPDIEEFPVESWGEPALAFLGCIRDDPDEAEAMLVSLTGDVDPIADFSEPTQFEELQTLLDEDYPDGLRYYWKSTYLADLNEEVIDLMLWFNETAPSPLSTVDIWWLGGGVAEVPKDATAFWHRDKPFMITFEANWDEPDDDEANIEWAREGFAAFEELSVTGGRYGNFPGFAEDPARLLFGENYDRLVDIKGKYDPENLFHVNQNISPRTETNS